MLLPDGKGASYCSPLIVLAKLRHFLEKQTQDMFQFWQLFKRGELLSPLQQTNEAKGIVTIPAVHLRCLNTHGYEAVKDIYCIGALRN